MSDKYQELEAAFATISSAIKALPEHSHERMLLIKELGVIEQKLRRMETVDPPREAPFVP
jgi:hypothetical protein